MYDIKTIINDTNRYSGMNIHNTSFARHRHEHNVHNI